MPIPVLAVVTDPVLLRLHRYPDPVKLSLAFSKLNEVFGWVTADSEETEPVPTMFDAETRNLYEEVTAGLAVG